MDSNKHNKHSMHRQPKKMQNQKNQTQKPPNFNHQQNNNNKPFLRSPNSGRVLRNKYLSALSSPHSYEDLSKLAIAATASPPKPERSGGSLYAMPGHQSLSVAAQRQQDTRRTWTASGVRNVKKSPTKHVGVASLAAAAASRNYSSSFDSDKFLDTKREDFSSDDEDLVEAHFMRDEDDDDNDFETVDWRRDAANERKQRRADSTAYRTLGVKKGCMHRVIRLLKKGRSWLLLFVCGISTGMIAAMIDVTVSWASDIKCGYCEDGWYLDQATCCDLANDCPAWKRWADLYSPNLNLRNSNNATQINAEASRAEYFAAAVPSTSQFWINFSAYVGIAVAMASLGSWLVVVYANYAAGSGIPELKSILGGVEIKRFLGGWTLLIKGVGLVLAVGSGLSLGKKGPYVHVSCCIANIFARCSWFKVYSQNQKKKRELLSGAAAAGVAVAFGAPVGGVLFSLEEASSYFPPQVMWRSFFCGLVAAYTLQQMNPYHTGKLAFLEVSYKVKYHWFEILPFIFIGCIGGILGTVFIRCNIIWSRYRKTHGLKNGFSPVLVVSTVAMVSAAINFQDEFFKIANIDLLRVLFTECTVYLQHSETSLANILGLCSTTTANHWKTMGMLLLSSALKLVLTIFTFGLALPAGLFIPTMCCGACIGRIVGMLMELLAEKCTASGPGACMGLFDACTRNVCITPGIYALVGAAAVLGGVTRVTISIVVIVFELTGGLEYIVPIMVAVMASKWVGDAFNRNAIYEEHVRLNEYPFLDLKENLDVELNAVDLMKTKLCTLSLHGNTIAELKNILLTRDYRGFPVVTNQGYLVGYASRRELHSVLSRIDSSRMRMGERSHCYFSMQGLTFPRTEEYVDLSGVLDSTPMQIAKSTPLDVMYDIFKHLGTRYCLVTNHGRLIGIVTKKDLLQLQDRLHRSHEDLHSPSNTPHATPLNSPLISRHGRRSMTRKIAIGAGEVQWNAGSVTTASGMRRGSV